MAFDPPPVEESPDEGGGWFTFLGGDGVFGWFRKFWSWMTVLPGQAWRVASALCQVGFIVFTFIVVNTENMARFSDQLPNMIEKALAILQNILNVGAGALSIAVPPVFAQGMAFVNTVLPLEEAFAGIVGLAGLYVLAVMIRIIKNLLIVWR